MEGLESLSFFRWVLRRIKLLLVIQAIALVLAVIFSSQCFMPREYKSYAVVYPSNMSDYSHESPSEQMLEFLNSADIKNQVITKFNLRQHYNLPQSGKPYYDKLFTEYDRNVIIQPTEYGAVSITIYDISPDTACLMVNALLNILNEKVQKVQQEKSTEVVNMWTVQLAEKKHRIDSMSSLSKQLSEQYRLLEYESQTKEVLRAYYQSMASGRSSKNDEISQQIKNLEDHGIEFRVLNQHIESAMLDYAAMEAKYEDAVKDVNKHFTYWNLVSAPFKADSYSYPLRLLIILGACFAAFIFSIVIIRITERVKPALMGRSDKP